MTEQTACRHDTIVTWGTPDNRLWACASCSRRFYPACETCVSIGHRREVHEDVAGVLDVKKLAYAIAEAESGAEWTPWGSEYTNADLIAEKYNGDRLIGLHTHRDDCPRCNPKLLDDEKG